MDASITLGILLFIGFSIPVVSSLWRLFAVREQLQSQIVELDHKIELQEQQLEGLVDRHVLAFNGLKEVVGHVRERTQGREQHLEFRLSDIERFLEKNTAFERRNAPN